MSQRYVINFYSQKVVQIWDAILTNNEEKLIVNLKNIPVKVINNSGITKHIIKKLLETKNVNLLHILIIYGMDCNSFISVIYDYWNSFKPPECYAEYLENIVNKEYEHYYENPVFCVIHNNLDTYFDELLKWNVNPIHYSIIHNCTYILSEFINDGTIPLETYFKQSCFTGKEQFLKYWSINDHLKINTSNNSENNLCYNCEDLDSK